MTQSTHLQRRLCYSATTASHGGYDRNGSKHQIAERNHSHCIEFAQIILRMETLSCNDFRSFILFSARILIVTADCSATAIPLQMIHRYCVTKIPRKDRESATQPSSTFVVSAVLCAAMN